MLLTCAFVGSIALTGCKDDNADDNGQQGGDGDISAVDNGLWPVSDSHMDTSVKPGDDFYMYANGTYWKNTVVPIDEKNPNNNAKGYDDDLSTAFKKKVAALTDANFQKLENDVNKLDATTAQSKQKYDEMVEQSGFKEAVTREDLWKSFGRMASMGVATCLDFEPFFLNGKVKLYVSYRSPEMFGEGPKDKSDDSKAAAKARSLQAMIKDNPSLLSAMMPLQGEGTRSIDKSRWPNIVLMLEAMGLNPADCYAAEEFAIQTGNDINSDEIKKSIAESNEQLDGIEKMGFDELKIEINNYVTVDSALISTSAMQEFNTVARMAQAINPDAFMKPMSTKGIFVTLDNVYMGYLRSKLTAEQMMTATVKQQMTDAALELRDVFRSRIENNEWMSQGSKNNAIEKLDNMMFCIGYPEKWITEALPDISQSKSLVEDVYILRMARLNLFKAVVGKDRTDADIIYNVTLSDNTAGLFIDNAFYNSNFNAMIITPYYCLPPFFDAKNNQAFNYATLSITGHEITHGFDTGGAKFNKIGDPSPIWANEADAQEFEHRAEMLVECYNGFEMLPDELPGVMANGKATITENIADLGGAEIAFQAYNNYLTKNGFKGTQLKLQRQRFFRGIAEIYRSKYNKKHVEYLALGKNKENKIDVHSMNKERVNGIYCNMDGWYEAYDVQPGDKLYRTPEKRVRIW